LAGRTFDKGVNPFQDFATLLELRNSLVHLKFDRTKGGPQPNEIFVDCPPVVSRLRSKNVLAEFEGASNVVTSWVNRVSTPAVARWACNVVAAMVKDIVDSIPPSDLREMTDLFYCSGAFAPVV
jgi:hypothetical protein